MRSSRAAAKDAFIDLIELLLSVGWKFGEKIATYSQLKIKSISRSTYYRNIIRFEQHGLISRRQEKGRGYRYELTDLALKLRKSPIQKNKRRDGLSTIIMFDVPEEKHRARDNFRRYLVKNGYTMVQKSVFISPFVVSPNLLSFAEELGIYENVSILSGKIDRIERR